MSNKYAEINIQILLALYGCTVEQMEMLNDDVKFLIKRELNKWKKSGSRFESVVFKQIELAGNSDDYDDLKDIIHDAMNKIRDRYLDKSKE